MRCSGWSSLAISACSALLLASAASAHVVPGPTFLSTGESATLALSGPNERDEEMTSFSVTVPGGLEIVRAHPAPGWVAGVEGAAATWTGGSLAPGDEATFELELEVLAEPGLVELEAVQGYPGGEVVRWPVRVTILPAAASSPSRSLGWALTAGLAGLLAVGGVAALAWRRRRTRALQER